MLLFFCISGCKPMEYDLISPEKSNAPPENEEVALEVTETDTSEEQEEVPSETQEVDPNDIDPDDIVPKMRLDTSIQHMRWGDQQMRCQIQIAFSRRWYPPPEEEEEPGPPPDPHPRPEYPGDCVFVRNESIRRRAA